MLGHPPVLAPRGTQLSSPTVRAQVRFVVFAHVAGQLALLAVAFVLEHEP